jgi:hypothetical protein
MVHIASSRRLCGVKAEDGWVDVTGCIRLFYPNFTVFIVLGTKGILILFSLLIGNINRIYGGWSSLRLLLVFICISYIRDRESRTEFYFQ